MNCSSVDEVARVVLYEGYLLYPYRPSSVKNQQRWTFGGILPRDYCLVQGDTWAMQTECLLRAGPNTTVQVRVRFLHLQDRTVGLLTPALSAWPTLEVPAFESVPILEVGERTYHPWQEATEREIILDLVVEELCATPRPVPFSFPAGRALEPVLSPTGKVVGVLSRQHQSVAGEIEATVRRVGGLVRLTLRVHNLTRLEEPEAIRRDQALHYSLLSTHTILQVRGGEFVSMIDPPEDCQAAAAECRNVGTWPVLAGEEGTFDTLLSSPIILYDYPRIAAESPGDLFDATEIDEILTLRILAMTPEEKRERAAVDERASRLLARTEALTSEQMIGLHGVVRSLRTLPKESPP